MTRDIEPIRRISLHIENEIFDAFVAAETTRGLTEACGSFRLEVHDRQRGRSIAERTHAQRLFQLGAGRKVKLAIDGEVELIGHIDGLQTRIGRNGHQVTLVGRDVVGDMVDCAAAPDGPLEYLGLDALGIAKKIAAPFGIKVYATTDVGAVFKRFAFEAEATAMAVIEKACRARALLPLSDGVGGLVLTRGGSDMAPGSLEFGRNIFEIGGTEDWSRRFSTYKAKGQAEKIGKLDGTAQALDDDAPASKKERAGTAISGLARDRTITRYRPTVISTRTESNSVSAEEQAAWAMRVGRGQSLKFDVSYHDWRGENGGLWKPNQLVPYIDRYHGLDMGLLIEQVTKRYDGGGTVAQMTLVGPEAYDLIPEDKKRKGKKDKHTGPLDGKAEGLK